ncbi:MAG: hypothetical protein ACK443_02780 [Methylococcaceae bacterium]
MPDYITRNRYGVFIFQYRFPQRIHAACPSLPILFRRSLRTRYKRDAIDLARRWWVIMDEIARRFFSEPAVYARAVELLSRYEAVEGLSWESVESYLSGLDEEETALLDKALVHRNVQTSQSQHQQLLDKIGLLEKTVEALTKSGSFTSAFSVSDSGSVRRTSAESNRQPSPITDSSIPIYEWKPDPDDLPLSVLAERFIEQKKRHVRSGTAISLEGKVTQFVSIVTEYNEGTIPSVSELTMAKIRTYRDVLIQVPARRNGLPKNCSYRAMLKMNLDPISPKTVKDTTVLVGEFLTWLETEGYPITRGLKSIFSSVKKPKARDSKSRVPFTDDDLRRLFLSEPYLKGTVKRPSEFWVPLLALFTGARLAELVQLHCSDVYSVDGIWVLDLNELDGKFLKSENSKRIVPIHSALIELGFLDFVKLRKKTSPRLFPEEERTPEGKFDAYSKRFQAYRKSSA